MSSQPGAVDRNPVDIEYIEMTTVVPEVGVVDSRADASGGPLISGLKQAWGKFLNPKHSSARAWEVLVALCIALLCHLEIFMVSFKSSQAVLWVIAYLCDFINLADVFFMFFKGYINEKGVIVSDRVMVRRKYLRGHFILDLVSILPLDILAAGFIPGIAPWKLLTLVRLNRLVRLYKVFELFDHREAELGTNTALLRSCKYALMCLLVTHSMTCAWHAMACEGDHYGVTKVCYPGTWANNSNFYVGFDVSTSEAYDAYLVCLYWAMATATSTGYGDISAVSVEERWFSIGAMLLGISVFFGMLLGGMTSMLTNFDQQRAAYVHRLETIKHQLLDRGISPDMCEQVMGYYEYLWVRKRGVLSEGIYNALPLTFQAEISHTTNSSILEKAPIFDGLGEGFLRMLSLNIKAMLYLPQQIIITRGDVGHTMFFIHRGEVEVLSEEDDYTPIATLKAGKLFGEVSLIYSLPRTATIRAKTHCDLMVLEKADLQAMLAHYPEGAQGTLNLLRNSVSNRIQEVAKDRCTTADMAAIEREKELSASYKAFQERKTPYIAPPPNTSGRRTSFSPIKETRSSHLGLKKSVHHTGIAISESVEVIRTDEDLYKYKSFHEFAAEHQEEDVSCPTWARENIEAWWWRVKDTTLDPHSYLSRVWEEFVICVIFGVSFLYPYMACFTAFQPRYDYFESPLGESALAISYCLDLILLCDLVVCLRTGVPTPHGTLVSFDDIVEHYCKSTSFFTDLVAVLPLEILCLATPAGPDRNRMFAFLRLNRVLKFFKVPKMFQRLEEMLDVSILKLRTVKFLLYITIMSHWVACCLYIVVCYGTECAEGSWFALRMEAQSTTPNATTPVTEYITALYFAAATMSSTGYGDISAHTRLGRLFSLTSMLLGLLLYGYCLAVMTATLANLDAPLVRFQEKLFAIKNFMRERHLGLTLQDRVMSYLSIVWEKYRGEWMPGNPAIMHDMPVVLQQDISMEDTAELLSSIPLFKNTDESFLRNLCLRTVPYLFSPGDVIVYAGDMGREMYIVRRGVCLILSPDLKTELAEIGPGQYFGEIGMLFGDYRTASVQAKTHCELLQIKMKDVLHAIKDFPILQTQFENVQNNREYLSQLKRAAKERLETSVAKPGSFKTLVQEAARELTLRHRSNERRKSYTLGDTATFSSVQGDHDTQYVKPFSDLSRVASLFSRLLMRRTFLPRGRLVKVWSVIMVVVCWVNAVTVPLQASFLHQSVPLWVLHYIMDLLCFLNIYFGLHTAYYNEEAILVTHPLPTAINYLRSNFLLDLLSCFPIEVFGVAAYPHFTGLMSMPAEGLHLFAILRINRLLQLFRLPLAFSFFESNVEKQTGNIRLIKFGFYMIIFINGLTCGLFLLGCPPTLSLDPSYIITSSGHRCLGQSWLTNAYPELSNATSSGLYSISIYWATATAVSVGYGDISAYTSLEMCIALLFMILGVLFFGYIIASVAASLANADAQRARYQEKLSAIKTYMVDQDINQALQERIINYYEYVWLRTRGVEPEFIFDGLPLSLWGDVTLSLYEETISKISLFQGTEVSFIKMLSKCIKPMLFLKGEYLVRKFDIGSEMFFIHRGAVDVVSEDGSMVFDTMRAGAAFGEVALLFQCPRTASIRARFNTDVFVLYKQDLDMALEFYPAIRDQILRIAEERRQQARKRSATKVAPPKPKSPPPPPPSSDDNDNNSNSLTVSNVNNNAQEEAAAAEETEEAPPSAIRRLLETVYNANRFTVSPDNKWADRFFAFLTVLRVISLWLITYQFGYQDHSAAVIAVNYTIDVIFIFEMYIRFHMSVYDEQGDLIEDFHVVYERYLKSPSGFALDLCAAFPLEIFALAAPADLTWKVLSILRLNHLLRYVRMSQYFTDWQKELDVNMLMVRLIDNLVTTGLLIHIFACLWYVVACPLGHCHPDSWVAVAAPGNILNTYCTSVYWCVATMTSTGYGDIHAYSAVEMLLSMLAMILGKLMFGFVLGSIASTLANAESQRVMYDMKLQSIKENMADQHVPKTLRHRVVDYYDYLWLRNKGVVIKSLFKDCPSCMMAEIALSSTNTMLSSIPLFEDGDDSFKRMISQRVDQLLFLPGDYIVRKGDMGRELYFIHKGEVEVITEDSPPQVTDVLHEGQLFGEVSLVVSVPRRVTIRARTHVDILTLSKQDLDDVLQNYPVLEASINEQAKKRFSPILNKTARHPSFRPETVVPPISGK